MEAGSRFRQRASIFRQQTPFMQGMRKGTLEKTKDQAAGKQTTSNGKVLKTPKRDFISWNLLFWSKENGFTLKKEYQFHPERKMAVFDWAIPDKKIGIEYQGGIFMNKSGHSNMLGQKRDHKKFNSAQILGWKVLTYNALSYLEILKDLKEMAIAECQIWLPVPGYED